MKLDLANPAWLQTLPPGRSLGVDAPPASAEDWLFEVKFDGYRLLARVDGKSPVEYLTADADKNRVRRVARAYLSDPEDRLDAIRTAWEQELRA